MFRVARRGQPGDFGIVGLREVQMRECRRPGEGRALKKRDWELWAVEKAGAGKVEEVSWLGAVQQWSL